ncbi:MAG: helix-turn-helix transcriptional regulator [Janthinobacterium lividum]
MLFQFGAHSSLLLPFVVPGVAATLWLLGRALRRGALPDALLALLIGLPTLTIAQWMLGYAGWYDSHDWHSTFMFYVPWQLNLLLGPAYYLYFRSLTNQEFRLFSRAWWHLLPGLFKVGLFVVAIAYDLLWVRVVRAQPLPAHFGTKGAAAVVLDALNTPLAYLIFVLLPIYTWWVLVDYRRYRRYLNDNFSDAERLRFAGLRQLLLIQVLTQVLSLLFTILDAVFDFGYAEAWYYFVLRGLFIYGLIAIGIQANYAAATSPLRFEPSAPATVDEEEPASTLASGQAPAVEAAPTVAESMPVAAPRRAAEPAALAPELLPLRDKLLDLMQTNQPWLEPELTLTELALRLRTNSALLSKVINAGCGQNFNDFVNTYRVQEAQRKLADPRFAHYSLVGVALESGFNSKSTFNRVFKKLLGQAPSEVVRPKS